MKKPKTIAIVIALLIITLFNSKSAVYAISIEEGYVTVQGDITPESDRMTLGSKGNVTAGDQNKNVIKYNGMTAYCINPGMGDFGKDVKKDQCTMKDITDSDLGKEASYIFDNGGSTGEKANALRIVALDEYGAGTMNASTSYRDIMGAAQSYATGGKVPNGITINKDAGADLAKGAIGSLSGKGSSGGVKTTLQKLKSGQLLTVTNNSKGEATLNLGSFLTGDNKIAPGATKSFSLTGKSDASGNCAPSSIPNPNVSYPSNSPSGKSCSQVVQFDCGSGNQQFIGCGEENDIQKSADGKEAQQQINEGQDIPIDCPPEDKCPFDPEEFLDIPNPAPDRVADILCDAGGTTTYINQLSKITDSNNTENCAFEGDNQSKNFDSEYCDLYCIEDYDFYVDKYSLDDYELTAGTYFNFNPEELTFRDRVSVTCYTRNKTYQVMENILALTTYSESNKYNDYRKEECTCEYNGTKCPTSETFNSNTQRWECPVPEVPQYTRTVTEEIYVASIGDGFKIDWKHDPQIIEGPETLENSCDCDGSNHYVRYNNDNKTGPNYAAIAEYSKTFVNDYNTQCVDEIDVQSQIDKCEKKVSFEYYDGNKNTIKVTPKEFIKVSEKPVDPEPNKNINAEKNCPSGGEYNRDLGTSYESCNNGIDEKTINVGGGKNIDEKLKTSTVVSRSAAKETVYKLVPPTIYNNYSTGERSYDTDNGSQRNYKGWPIDYATPQGQYRYKFKVEGIETCTLNDQDFGQSEPKDSDINCVYKVNGCGGCTYWCDETKKDGSCDYHKCQNSCIYKCLGAGCIYDSGAGLAINYQPISLINIDAAFAFLNDKYNSVATVSNTKMKLEEKVSNLKPSQVGLYSSSKNTQNWVGPKAEATLKKLERGEEIYSDEPEYRFVLTPQVIGKIQEYNSSNNFTTSELKCSARGDYVTCQSKFIRETLKGYINNSRGKASMEINATFTDARDAGIFSYTKNTPNSGPAWK